MHLLPRSLVIALVALAFDAGADEPPALATPELAPMEQGVPPVPTITLREAIRVALLQSATVATAVDEVQRSEALTTQARSFWLPTASGNVVLTHLDGNRTLPGSTTVISSQNQASANLLLTVPLFAPRPFTNWLSVRDLEAALKSGAADARRTVATSVARAYLTVLAQHQILDGDLQAVAAGRAHVDFDKARYKGGVGTLTDLVRSQQQLASDETAAANARTALIRSREQLGVIVASDHPLDVTTGVELPEVPTSETQALKEADKRPDIEELRQKLDVTGETVRHAWADYVPFISATVQPFYQNPKTLTVPNTGWQALGLLTWPIYDGGLRYGQQAEREVLDDEARLNLEAGQRQARSEVRAALGSVEFADAALMQAREAAKLAHQALGLVASSYRAGASTNIEVIDAQRAALDADIQAAIAEDTARQSRVDLLSATGQLP